MLRRSTRYWESGEAVRVLSESREVTRARFVQGESLVVLLRPRDEEEFEGDAFKIFVGGTLHDLRPFDDLGLRSGDADPRLAGNKPTVPAELGLEPGAYEQRDHELQWRVAFAVLSFEQRGRVWNVGWNDAGHLLGA